MSAENVATPDKLKQLNEIIGGYRSLLIAYSGGVDSAFLLFVAQKVLDERCLAVTGDSDSIARDELDHAVTFAQMIGARHRVVATNEMQNPDYVANGPDRCFHCKATLFATLREIAVRERIAVIAEGSNFDDLSDYRPGMKAAEKYRIVSPLKEAGLTKREIRDMSHEFELPTWEKPSAPCLSSRIPYGSEVTRERLKRIEAAEKYIHNLGFPVVRVRDYGQMAKIEVPREQIERLNLVDQKDELTNYFHSLGYDTIAVDPRGYRSGSLNEALGVKKDG